MADQESPKLLVIADDLTGAVEAGGLLVSRGVASFVCVNHELLGFPAGYEAVVVNTESRHVEAAEAAIRVRNAALRGREEGIEYFYKKTDSTLRGNLGAELEAVLRATGAQVLPFVAAHPEVGRTTKNGIHFINGVPLAESAFRNDTLNPVTESCVAKVLHGQSKLPAATVTHDSLPKDGMGFWIFDCERKEDFALIARSLREQNRTRVLAGTAAFVQELPGLIPFQTQPCARALVREPILAVNGSLNEVSLEQVRNAPETFAKIHLSSAALPNASASDWKNWQESQFVSQAGRGPRGAGNILLHTSTESPKITGPPARQTEARELAAQITKNLGQVVRQMLESHLFATLIISGGDTFMGIAKACGWRGLRPLCQLSPGITACHPEGSDLLLITKPGGFGQRDFYRAVQGHRGL